jgi:hypothetical protein
MGGEGFSRASTYRPHAHGLACTCRSEDGIMGPCSEPCESPNANSELGLAAHLDSPATPGGLDRAESSTKGT